MTAPGQLQVFDTSPGFARAQISTFLPMTAPPQGLRQASGMTAPPQGIAPVQDVTAPPQSIAPGFELSEFRRFDSDGDAHWNKSELGAYLKSWSAVDAGFVTKGASGWIELEAAGYSISLDGLMSTYDRDGDQLLDFAEASALYNRKEQILGH